MPTLSDHEESVLKARVHSENSDRDSRYKKTVILLAVILVVGSVSAYLFIESDEDDHREDLNGYPFYYEYPSLEELYDWYDDLVDENLDIVRKIWIGRSWEGRDIWAVKVSDDVEKDQSEPSILINGNIHAREWSTSQVASYFLWKIVSDYDTNETINWLVDHREIYVVPMANPDGYHYDGNGHMGSQKSWRKNRNDSTPTGGVGVDLNRNWDNVWYEGKSDPSSDLYRGGSPFSEYETKCLRDFILEKEIDSFQDIHSHHGALLIPWGHTNESCPHDDWYRDLASDMTSLTTLFGDEDMRYTYGQPCQALNYSSPGGAYDWVYGETGAVSLTYEIYTGGVDGYGFYPPKKYIMDINRDVYDSLVYQARVADAELGDGDDDRFPPNPHIVYGNLSSEDDCEPLVRRKVFLRNEDTGEEVSVETDENGYFEFDLTCFTEEGYDDQDRFLLIVGEDKIEFELVGEWGQRIDGMV